MNTSRILPSACVTGIAGVAGAHGGGPTAEGCHDGGGVGGE